MNIIALSGRLAADSEIRYTAGGDPCLTFRVGDSVGFGDKKATNWWNCTLWGKRGEHLKSYLTKGQAVTVYGMATMREWDDKDGNKRMSPDVRVYEIELQGGKQEQSAPRASRTADIPEDVPF